MAATEQAEDGRRDAGDEIGDVGRAGWIGCGSG
jgi:hypothetical protein